jgi:RNA-binding protein
VPPRTMKEIKRVGHGIKASVHVGKEGVTDTLIEEIARQVKGRKVVKIRILPSVDQERRLLAEELASRSRSVLVEVIGHIVLLCDRRYMEGREDIDHKG